MSNRVRLSASEIAAKVKAGACSAVDVALESLARTEAYDRVQPQTWIQKASREMVLEQARRVDARLAAGESLPLAGVPYAVKDNIDVAGLPTTAACPQFAYSPGRSALVVEALAAAGAVMVGKTNLDQFATGLVGARSPYGACGCVYNLDYISGGSSSGSAVAVAAGLVAFALGTDTAGSGRVPAAFNHLVGLKPTKGRWSSSGLTPACRTLDCITVLAGSVADAALVDGLVAGFDFEDPYSRGAPQAAAKAIGKVGVPRADQLNFFGDAESERLFAEAVARLRRLPVEIAEVDISTMLNAAELLYAGPWVAERAAAAHDLLTKSPGAIHPVVRGILQSGLQVTGVDVFKGQYAMKAYERAVEAVWADVDALMLPTAPTIYRISEVLAEPLALNSRLGRYTNFVNLLDMSAIAMPAGFRDNRTGFGVTFMGPAFADRALVRLAERFERATAFEPPPLDLTGPVAQTVKLAVAGGHLAGMPLHWQLTSREARLAAVTTTAPSYRLFAMAEAAPGRPALVRTDAGGAAIEVEVYELAVEQFGAFVAEVAEPLAIGVVTLADGSRVKGFLAEPRALHGATEITALGGWRAYLASLE
jgi:allophanate hydrolase